MKKILFSVLFLLLLLAGVTASAASVEDLTYKISNDEVTITECKRTASGELVIPDTIENKKVTAIGDQAFYNCSDLTKISIPNSVASIGYNAFENCKNLTTVNIPASIISILEATFYNCQNLTSITIPNNVTSIGDFAFEGCEKLTNVSIGKGVSHIGLRIFAYCYNLTNINVDANNSSFSSNDGVLFNKNKTSLVQYPIGNTATTYGIPNSVTSIGAYSFHWGVNLTEIIIPDSVVKIGEKAFSNCENLNNITIPDSVTSIGKDAFYLHGKLTTVYRPISATWTYNFGSNISVIDVCKIKYKSGNKFIATEYVELNKNAKMLTPSDGYIYRYTVDGKEWTGKNITDNAVVIVAKLRKFDTSLIPVSVSGVKNEYSYKVNMKSASAITGELMVCLYDLNGRMTALNSHIVENKSDYCAESTITSETSATEYRAFMCSAWNSLVPIAESVSVKIE